MCRVVERKCIVASDRIQKSYKKGIKICTFESEHSNNNQSSRKIAQFTRKENPILNYNEDLS